MYDAKEGCYVEDANMGKYRIGVNLKTKTVVSSVYDKWNRVLTFYR